MIDDNDKLIQPKEDMNKLINEGENMNPVEIKEDAKKIATVIINKLQVYGFWCLIVTAIGFYGGIKHCNNTRATATADSIKQGTFIYDGAVYEVKKRVVQ